MEKKRLVIIEGINKAGKTTYIKENFKSEPVIKLPCLFLKDNVRDLMNDENAPIYVPLLIAEHIAVLEILLRRENNESVVLDRSFISFFVYQNMYINFENDNIKYLLYLIERLKKEYDIKVFLFLNKKTKTVDENDEIEKMEYGNLEYYKNQFEHCCDKLGLEYELQ